ncbi:MAG: hypothetical protein AAF372_01115 [Pseudomonadota bacterium]
MPMKKLLFISLTLFLAFGCSQNSEDEVSNSVIIDTQINALDKAKNVEDVLQQSNENQRNVIDQ